MAVIYNFIFRTVGCSKDSCGVYVPVSFISRQLDHERVVVLVCQLKKVCLITFSVTPLPDYLVILCNLFHKINYSCKACISDLFSVPCLYVTRKPPLEDMSGESKSTRIFLSETISGREKSIFSWSFKVFEVPLHIRSVIITLIFSTIKVLIFVEMTKKNASFFVPL